MKRAGEVVEKAVGEEASERERTSERARTRATELQKGAGERLDRRGR